MTNKYKIQEYNKELCAIFREHSEKRKLDSLHSLSTSFRPKSKIWGNIVSGDNGVEETLLSIPNRKVKLYSADGTAWETVWESKTLPGYKKLSFLYRIDSFFSFIMI